MIKYSNKSKYINVVKESATEELIIVLKAYTQRIRPIYNSTDLQVALDWLNSTEWAVYPGIDNMNDLVKHVLAEDGTLDKLKNAVMNAGGDLVNYVDFVTLDCAKIGQNWAEENTYCFVDGDAVEFRFYDRK